jgi:hypothetical protein
MMYMRYIAEYLFCFKTIIASFMYMRALLTTVYAVRSATLPLYPGDSTPCI